MRYDRKITITTGASRKATNWQPQTMLVSELWARLQAPVRGTETQDAYLKMSKGRQDELKDVGGFVAGTLNGPRRKASAVKGRDLITLDLDSIPAGGTEDILRRVGGLGCGYCVYSTRKHHPGAPRLRVLVPLDRTATADEYEPLARKLAELIGLTFCDPSTFEASRLMYWPSCSADGEYIYTWEDKPLLSVDVLLVHPASCAYGLNLQQGGRHVVWYGLNWSFELNDQGNCRLYRQGSPYEKVYVHYLVVQGCEDEDVMATVHDRLDTHEAVMGALKARIKRVKEGIA